MKRILSLFAAVCLLAALFAGCGGDPGNPAGGTAAPAQTAAPTAEPASPYRFAKGNYPVDDQGFPTAKYNYDLPITTTDEILTMWTTNRCPQYLPEGGYGEESLPQEVLRRTGVKVEYSVISPANRGDQFSVLIASDDLLDIMCGAESFYTGNFKNAILDDGYFVNLYDYREYMPNYLYEARVDPTDYDTLSRVFEQPTLIMSFYGLSENNNLKNGYFARGDWLNHAGWKNTDIVTFDDTYDMLMYFKSQEGCEYPMTLYSSMEQFGLNEWVGYDTYCSCSGINTVYVVDGKVRLANMNDNDKELMTMVNKWFTDGLIDPNWASYSSTLDFEAKIDTSELGYVMGGATSILTHNAVIPEGEEVGWVPIGKPLLYEGQTLHLGFNVKRISWGSAAISTKCENVPLAVSWLDYRYSEDGKDLYGYGVQGVSWEYDANGERWILDEVVNHPAHWSMIMCTYALNTLAEPGISVDSDMSIKGYEVGKDYLQYWTDVPHDNNYVYPSSVKYTDEERDERGRLGGDIESYLSENYLAFVDGSKPLSEWDAYVEQLHEIGIDKVLEIYQAAYDRFMAERAAA